MDPEWIQYFERGDYWNETARAEWMYGGASALEVEI
jgi:hypothetical protein